MSSISKAPSVRFQELWTRLPVTAAVDVAVVGGGPAGCAAAIAAAREGATTVLIEQFGFLGGMATAALVPAWCPFSDRRTWIVRGIGLEILEEMKSSMPHVAAEAVDWVPIDPEALKAIYDRRVTQAGARVLFLTHFVDVLLREDSGDRQAQPTVSAASVPPSLPLGGHRALDSIVLHNKSGLQRIEARVVVDCTGDADVAAAAGLPFHKGDPQTGDLQPCTMCFVLAGVDNARLQPWLLQDNGRNLLLKPSIAAAKAAGDLDIPEEGANVAYQSPTTIGLNFGHVFDVDGTDADQLSEAMIEGRRLVRHLVDFIRKYLPGCEQAYLVNSGVQIGVRETRRIVGDYVLTLDDYLNRRGFADEIARNAYYIDIHLSRKEWEQQLGRPIDWAAKIHQYQPGESHGIPYRCLTPLGAHNLLVAGRCISTDRAVQGSTRVMPNCLAMGEAAGVAAAWAARHADGNVRAVDIPALRARLRNLGAWLP